MEATLWKGKPHEKGPSEMPRRWYRKTKRCHMTSRESEGSSEKCRTGRFQVEGEAFFLRWKNKSKKITQIGQQKYENVEKKKNDESI